MTRASSCSTATPDFLKLSFKFDTKAHCLICSMSKTTLYFLYRDEMVDETAFEEGKFCSNCHSAFLGQSPLFASSAKAAAWLALHAGKEKFVDPVDGKEYEPGEDFTVMSIVVKGWVPGKPVFELQYMPGEYFSGGFFGTSAAAKIALARVTSGGECSGGIVERLVRIA